MPTALAKIPPREPLFWTFRASESPAEPRLHAAQSCAEPYGSRTDLEMSQKLARNAIIKRMISSAYKVDQPRDWQVAVIYELCYETSTSLCVQKTGGGKSLLVLGTMALLRGVAIVIEPLKSIGTDQAASARAACPRGMHAFDVDGLTKGESADIIGQLGDLREDTKSAVILYMSPQSLGEDRPWGGLVVKLLGKSLLRLVAFDEADSVPEDGFVFRREFALLKTRLVSKVTEANEKEKKVAMLAMTATMTKELLGEFEKMMAIKFLPSNIHWGDTSRVGDLKMTLYVGNKVADSMKRTAKRHLECGDGRKVVFGANDKKRVKMGLTPSMNDYFKSGASSDATREAKAFHGDLGDITRQYYVHRLSSSTPSESLNLSLLNTTSAGFRGLNARGIGLAAFDGLPMSLIDLAQFMGRIRSAAPELEGGGENMNHEFHLAASATSLTDAITQIHLDNHLKNRQRRLASLWEVLTLVAVPEMCVHGALAAKFSRTGKGGGGGGGCRWCWYCPRCSTSRCGTCYDCWPRPPRGDIISCISVAVNGAKRSATDLVKALSSKKGSGLGLTVAQAHRLFLQLAAKRILQYEVIDRSKEGDKERDLSIVWCWGVANGRFVHTGADARAYWYQILGEE